MDGQNNSGRGEGQLLHVPFELQPTWQNRADMLHAVRPSPLLAQEVSAP
jgi:hypothetical protein